jgi:presenilin-like A22 family membrane protease
MQPFLWSSLILAISQTLTFYVAFREKDFLEYYQITPPQVSLGLPIIYFFGAVILLGVILFLVPVAKLRIFFRIMFVFLFCWGVFIFFGLSLSVIIASTISLTAGLLWFFRPKVWLHNLLMMFALASAGSVFGRLFSPWTAMSFMLVISVYDVLAVRFGYMMWLVKRLSEFEALPAFFLPKRISSWNLNLKQATLKKLLEDRPDVREFAVLGGGDIGFPLLLTASVFFTYGLTSALIVAMFSLGGLASAYLIHLTVLKGKPTPALPPITFVSLIGFLIIYLVC